MKKLFVTFTFLFLSAASHADDKDHGCKVMMCMSNPNGWTAVQECNPPIEKLKRDLAKKRPFPTCQSGNSNSSHNWASASYCPEQYLVAVTYGDETKIECKFAGAVNIVIDGKPYTRVWWNANDSVTEAFGEAKKQPGISPRFENDRKAWVIEQERLRKEKEERDRQNGY